MKYLKLMRVKHYLKNVLVFLPLIFSKSFLDVQALSKSFVGFIAFSLISSVVYILNDLNDIEKDKNHPVKKNRPLASGAISKGAAIALMFSLIIIIILLLLFSNLILNLGNILLLIYLIINIFYSFGLKDVPLLDITILSFGFVLRVLYGGFIISTPISSWLFLTVLSISFYMALGKRKNELIKLKDGKSRKVLQFYTKDFLEKNMYMFLTLSIVFYSLWSTLGITIGIFRYSIVFVILILMKYNMNIEHGGFGDPVDVIFSDKILIIMSIIYAVFCISALYVF